MPQRFLALCWADQPTRTPRHGLPFCTDHFGRAYRTTLRHDHASRTLRATLRDYLRAVRSLDELGYGPRKFHHIASFQGGVQLLRHVWGLDPEGVRHTRTIDMHVARLREKFGDDGPRVLLTVRGKGYKVGTGETPSEESRG